MAFGVLAVVVVPLLVDYAAGWLGGRGAARQTAAANDNTFQQRSRAAA